MILPARGCGSPAAEHVLGELQAMGLLAGANAADRRQLPHDRRSAPEEDHALLEALGMPVADGPGEGRS